MLLRRSPDIRSCTSSISVRLTRGRPRDPPQAALEREDAVGQRAQHELAQVQRVARLRATTQRSPNCSSGAAERRLDQRRDGLVAQRAELHAPRVGVLPQRLDRVRGRLAGADGGDDERAPGRRQVQHERGRDRVEQLRVVDAEDHRAGRGALAQRLRAAPHQLERVVGAHVVRDQAGDRAERHRRGAARGLHPGRSAPSRSAAACASRASRDLPTPAAGADDDAAAAPVPARAAMSSELGLTPHERPHACGRGRRR